MNSSTLISIGSAILSALSSVNWSEIFPSFSSLMQPIISFLEALLGFASAKTSAAATA